MLQTEPKPAGVATAASPSFCVGCEAEVTGKYCSQCGEKSASERHYDLWSFAKEGVEHLTHADTNVFRSLHRLLLSPGFLTNEFMAGRRNGYLGPVQLFLVINLAFFFLQSFFWAGPYTVPLALQMKGGSYSRMVRQTVAEKVATTHASIDELEREFDEAERIKSKEFCILMVPIFAAVLAVVEIDRRRFVVQHLVFSLHYYAFLMFFAFLFVPLLHLLALLFNRHPQGDPLWLIILMAFTIASYLYFALRTAYHNGPASAIFRALLLTLTTSAVMELYRFFLFFAVMRSL